MLNNQIRPQLIIKPAKTHKIFLNEKNMFQ